MNDQADNDMDSIIDVLETQTKHRTALNILLENQRNQARHHLVLQVHMGEVESYVASVSLDWVANNIGFAADLPIFKEAEEGSKRINVDKETIEKIQQRKPDWSRQLQMTAYLATQRHHKFPPLLVVGYQGWVYDARHEKWGTDGHAETDSLTKSSLNAGGTYWDLDDSDTYFYALDGQHRLIAILGLKELIQSGHLHALDEKRNPKKVGGVSRDEMVRYIQEKTKESASDIHERLQHLMDEKIGVEIVPAVCTGERYEDALRRLRQMFVDVNEHAKSLSKGELAQLDETNGFRVVSRRLVAAHPLLSNDDPIRPMVEVTKPNLAESSECFTTLDTLVEISRRFLTENEVLPEVANFRSWEQFLTKGIFVRPEDAALKSGEDAMLEYFNAIAQIPSHEACIQGKAVGDLRKVDDNILFRPMVQTELARAVGKLVSKGVNLKNIVKELTTREEEGQLKLQERTAPWFGVLCDSDGRMRRRKSNADLCGRLLLYLLGGGFEDDSDREKLRVDFADQREIDNVERRAINLEGKNVATDEIRLPNPWR